MINWNQGTDFVTGNSYSNQSTCMISEAATFLDVTEKPDEFPKTIRLLDKKRESICELTYGQPADCVDRIPATDAIATQSFSMSKCRVLIDVPGGFEMQVNVTKESKWIELSILSVTGQPLLTISMAIVNLPEENDAIVDQWLYPGQQLNKIASFDGVKYPVGVEVIVFRTAIHVDVIERENGWKAVMLLDNACKTLAAILIRDPESVKVDNAKECLYCGEVHADQDEAKDCADNAWDRCPRI